MDKKFKVGLIRVLTTEDQDVLLAHERQIMKYFPDLEVETKCIPDQYDGIHSPELLIRHCQRSLKLQNLFMMWICLL